MWILKRLENHPIAILVILILVMLVLHLEVVPVSIMEARNFITAREMLTDGNWLLTTMNGQPRYQKPPLPSIMSAVFASLFGIKNLFAYRLPAVILVLIAVIYSYKLSLMLALTVSQSLRNALIVLTSFYVIGITYEAPSDIFTHGFMLIAIYQIFVLSNNRKELVKRLLIASFCLGFSILSKGPVSIYALFLPFIIAYGFTYKYTLNKKAVITIICILILGLAIGTSWYLYVRLSDPETFQAIAEKETSNWSSYNVRPFFYYWSFFTQSGLWTIPALIGLIYPYLKSKVSNLKSYQFTLIWTLAAVVLLSIIPEKKSRYLMPVLIPLALNTGFYIEYLIQNFKNLKNRLETWPVYFNFSLIAVIAISLPLVILLFFANRNNWFWLHYSLVSLTAFGIGILILKYLKEKNLKVVFYMSCLFFISLMTFGLPLVSSLKNSSYKSLSHLSRHLEENNLEVFSNYELAPEIIWQFGRKIKSLDNLKVNPAEEKTVFAILSVDSLKDLHHKFGKTYVIIKEQTYDLNFSEPNSKGYKDRLTGNLYLFEKK